MNRVVYIPWNEKESHQPLNKFEKAVETMRISRQKRFAAFLQREKMIAWCSKLIVEHDDWFDDDSDNKDVQSLVAEVETVDDNILPVYELDIIMKNE